MRILFMGTPEFAAVSLRALAQQHEIVAVFSQPDRPKGRGHTLQPTPVKVAATELGIPVFQPATLKDDEAFEAFVSVGADLCVVVAYGRILSRRYLEHPPLGCINLHASLLPKYRGAAPIQWAIINGEKVTGLTTMYMDVEMDTGDMIEKWETEIGENETYGALQDRLAREGAKLLCHTVQLIGEGKAPRAKQDDSQATYAPMLERETGKIDFTKPAQAVHNLIRGCNPSPAAYAFIGERRLKILSTRMAGPMEGKPGEVALKDRRLLVCCGDGVALELETVVSEGGKPMTGGAFYNGCRFQKFETDL